ncbi:MAG: hypothetical protein R3321_01210 [Nitrososphaeraceae archaeon]|nr:hypothetical protein [Nitrososphaeraceae archaeon]
MKKFYSLFYFLKSKVIHSYHYRFKKTSLQKTLISSSQKNWLDLGASVTRASGFDYADIFPVEELPDELQGNYFRWNVSEPDLANKNDKIYDFIRLQHVFEHLRYEEGQIALRNLFDRLSSGGIMLITVPDLKIYIKRYQRKCLDVDWSFKYWAEKNLPVNSPQSFYFSIFTHSASNQSHKWCYDREGLGFAIQNALPESTFKFIKWYHKEASIPFTHNRPLEDLCVLIKKK